jgi:hypothetical protein
MFGAEHGDYQFSLRTLAGHKHQKPATEVAGFISHPIYAAFFAAFTFAHRAL